MPATVIHGYNPIPETLFNVVCMGIAWMLAPYIRWRLLTVMAAFVLAMTFHYTLWTSGLMHSGWYVWDQFRGPVFLGWLRDAELSDWALLFSYWILPPMLSFVLAGWSRERAKRKLHDHLRASGLCVGCRYDLRGSDGKATCPECGTPIPPRTSTRWGPPQE